MITLRPAAIDIDWMLAVEAEGRAAGFINGDTREQHERQLQDPDCAYLLAEEDGTPVGYVLLAGLNKPSRVIELKRIVIVKTDRGIGRAVMRLAMGHAFGALNAHRLWLDAFEDNARAQHLYRALGFVHEGRLREAALRHGRHVSMDLYAILRSEYGA